MTNQERSAIVLLLTALLNSAPTHAAQEYGPALLARQAVSIRTPYLAQMAQVRYLQQRGLPLPGTGAYRSAHRTETATHVAAQTTFRRSRAWFKPWSIANEISQKIEWDKSAPLGTGFAREEAKRKALTDFLTSCLDVYEEQTKKQGLPTDDLAVTFAHVIALNTQLATASRLATAQEASLRQKMRAAFAHSPDYWADSDKQAVHESLVIPTMVAQAGYANAVRQKDQGAQATFREVARKNIRALSDASLEQLRNMQSGLIAP